MAKKQRTRDGYYVRGRFWYTRDPRDGHVRSTGCESLPAARIKRATWERDAADPAHTARAAETLSATCERLTNGRAALGKATAFHEAKLGHWLRIFGDDAPVSEVGTPDGFDRFVRQRRAEGRSDHTITKEVGCMLRALKLSKRLGLFDGDLSVLRPMDLSAGYVPRTRALDAAELAALLAELPPHRGAFVALCVGLGVRRGEAFALRPEHVDLAAGVVDVPGTKTEGARRVIPILPPFRRLVEAAATELPLRPWPSGADIRDLAAACARAGIERCSPNDLRRTHATLLRSANVDADTVRRLLGHSASSRMLEAVYDKPKAADLAARAGSLDAVTRQLGDALHASADGALPFRKSTLARGASYAGPDSSISRENSTVDTAGTGREPVGIDTAKRHSPAAHALAFAAARVLGRRVA